MQEVLFGKGKPYEKTIIFAEAATKTEGMLMSLDFCEEEWEPGEERASRAIPLIIGGQDVPCRLKIVQAVAQAIREAVAAEREACARVADIIDDSMAEAIAERIRARGQS